MRFLGFPALQSNNFGKKPPLTFSIVFLSHDQFSTFSLSKIKLKVFTFTCRNLQRNPSSQTLLRLLYYYFGGAIFWSFFRWRQALTHLSTPYLLLCIFDHHVLHWVVIGIDTIHPQAVPLLEDRPLV